MITKRILVLTAMFLVLSPLWLSFFVVDATAAIGSTTVTLYPVADAYVNSSTSASNYGSAASMYVGASSEQDFTYVKFDLTSIPSGANVISAKLEVYLSGIGGSIYGFPGDTIGAYYCADNSWTELGITWNNKPNFNPNPTSLWSFGLVYTYRVYKPWDVTTDVRTALPSRTITEVLKFERKTGDGYAVLEPREGANKPTLKVEYSTQPVFAVHLESTQDTGVTNNLGFITIADTVFSLPTNVDVVSGSYQVKFSGAYMFTRWETSGGVAVSDANAATTTISVTGGSGTLRAVGNVKRLEHSYDDETPELDETQKAGIIDIVRFTPLISGQLLTARFCINGFYSSPPTFKVHVMDDNRHDVVAPFEQTPVAVGWFDVDLSSYGISANAGTDFYVGMEWTKDYNPYLAEDRTNPSNRSWTVTGTVWEQETYSDFMIRAVVGTLCDRAIVVDGTVFYIMTESNSTLSGFQIAKDNKKLLFNTTGTGGTAGFCNVTIQNQLLGGPFTVTSDGQLLSEVLSYGNGTHTSLYLTYPAGAHRVEVTGTTIIPEFQTAIMLSIFTSIATIAVALRRRMRH
ncbi:MAG TPA: DNRLRE domain-containing protein [Candidatus Bathyarchaeia archaeon]|nr:DNRLRE domain-containing protein [Candidatus Bathyarchaeia archaeon]